MVGRALVRALEKRDVDILTVDRASVDLRDQASVMHWMERMRPDAIFLAAAKVGGILANAAYPVDFLYDNLMIEANVISASHRAGVEKLLFLGSTCIYPRDAEQPIREEALLTGPLEKTNEWYAIAKIAGIKLCQAYRAQYGSHFISAMPTNLYGPFDNFDLTTSHVLPALMRKIHEAKEQGGRVTIWGSGTPRREFLHVDDLAEALVFLMENYNEADIVNVGTGRDLSITELAETIADILDYRNGFDFDRTKPDGTLRKCADISKIQALGWKARIELDQGLRDTYRWFLENTANRRETIA